MTRHLGRHAETDEQLVVVSMLIPHQTTHALVVQPDKIGETLRRELMASVSGMEAQKSENLADVIGRRQYADTQKSILHVLHESQKLIRMPIDDVVMTPDGNHKLPLRTVLEALQLLPTADVADRFNPHTHNTVAEGQQEQVGIARNLLVEAEMLEADAHNKRAQAYKLAPSLRPKSPKTKAPVEAPTETAPTDTPVDATE
jgi:hypothetical protein